MLAYRIKAFKDFIHHSPFSFASSFIELTEYGQYIDRMQAFFQIQGYDLRVMAKMHLRQLRETAGLSVRELARQINESHTNVLYWETSGNLPRSNVLVPMARALGVTVEELLGEPKPRRAPAHGGKLGRIFQTISTMPRRQQDKVVEMIETLIIGQQTKANA